jgi:hypothetical protein
MTVDEYAKLATSGESEPHELCGDDAIRRSANGDQAVTAGRGSG